MTVPCRQASAELAKDSSVLQNFLLAAIVEIIIVLCMVTFELLRPNRGELEPAQRSELPSEIARVGRRPRLVSNQPPALSVVDFGASSLEPAPGKRIDTEEFFLAYEKAAHDGRMRALPPEEFVGPFKRLCSEAGIRTSKRGGRLASWTFRCAVRATSRSRAPQHDEGGSSVNLRDPFPRRLSAVFTLGMIAQSRRWWSSTKRGLEWQMISRNSIRKPHSNSYVSGLRRPQIRSGLWFKA